MYEFKTQPFAHQRECFRKHKDDQFAGILADMGTGKTKITIDIAGYKHCLGLTDRMLIVAPNDVHAQWIEEQLPEHCSVSGSAFVYRSKLAKRVGYKRAFEAFMSNTSTEFRVLAINYEAFYTDKGTDIARRFFRTSQKPPVIVLDEASRIKNPKAKSVVALYKLRREFPDSFRFIITGTPAAKSPVDMWSLFEFMQPGYMGCSYQAFTKEHKVLMMKQVKVKGRRIKIETGIDKEVWKRIRAYAKKHIDENGNIPRHIVYNIAAQYGMSDGDAFFVAKSERFTPFKNLEALQRKIAPASFAISKADCLDLPEKIYEQVKFDLTKQQKELIAQLRKYAVGQHQGETLTLQSKAQLGLRVLQICGGFFSHHVGNKQDEYDSIPVEGPNRKLQFLLNDIPEIGTQQFIVWAVFVPEILMLEKELGKICDIARIGGGNKGDRQGIIDGFKAGEIQGLVCHPQAAGYGLNLQKAGVQYWYSRNYRTEARLQAEDRSHRYGITKSPVYKDLIYNIPFEEAVLQSNKEGKDINDTFVTSDLNELFAT